MFFKHVLAQIAYHVQLHLSAVSLTFPNVYPAGYATRQQGQLMVHAMEFGLLQAGGATCDAKMDH